MDDELRFCCDKFAKQATALQAGRIGLYPAGACPDAQFERLERDDGWGINGCCGGGCFVVVGMKFCPYCGADLNLASTLGHVFIVEEIQALHENEALNV
jgi:hypothetical protein